MGPAIMEIRRKRNSRLSRFTALLAALFVLLSSPAAHAFRLVPIKAELAPSGRGATKAFRVENELDEPIAVQISMLAREMEIDGTEMNRSADDDFLVYPTQILLQPGQVQIVRVKWVGDAEPEKELAYRILAEQLPVNLNKEQPAGAQINLVVRYLGSIYIVPKGARPDVVFDSTEDEIAQDGERQLAITLHNRGGAHVVLRNLNLTLRAGGKTVRLGPDELEGVAGENLLAEHKRKFLIARPADLPEGPVEVELEYHRRR